MENDETTVSELKDLLVGSTVMSVEPVLNRSEGGIALFRIERDGKQRAFSLHATELD